MTDVTMVQQGLTLSRPTIVYCIEEKQHTLTREMCVHIASLLPALLENARCVAHKPHAVVLSFDAWHVGRAKEWFKEALPKESAWHIDVLNANHGSIRLTHTL